MSPDDRRDCAAQILWCGLALGPAGLDQRLQFHPCSVRQHRSSSHQEEQNVRNHNRFKREQALARDAGVAYGPRPCDAWGLVRKFAVKAPPALVADELLAAKELASQFWK